METGREHAPSMPLAAWTLARRTVTDSLDDRLPGLAAEIAFFSVFAIPPLLLALFGSIGYLEAFLGAEASAALRDQILRVAGTFLTDETVRDIIQPLVLGLLEQGRADITAVGLVLSLWSASRVTGVVIDAVRIAYDQPKQRPAWRRRGLALVLTMASLVAATVVLPMLLAGPEAGAALAQRFGLGRAVEVTWDLLYWPVVAVLGVVLLTFVYHVATPFRSPWGRDLPGALLALGIWLAGSSGLRLYAQISIEGNATYGSLAAPIVALLWIYVTAVAVLLGAELNAEIEKLWPSSEASPYAA